jgi:hypothetical protein
MRSRVAVRLRDGKHKTPASARFADLFLEMLTSSVERVGRGIALAFRLMTAAHDRVGGWVMGWPLLIRRAPGPHLGSPR